MTDPTLNAATQEWLAGRPRRLRPNDAVVQYIRTCYAEGYSLASCAITAGVTQATVSRWVRGLTRLSAGGPIALRIRRGKLSWADRLNIVLRAAEGESQASIAEYFGVSQSYVSQYLRSHRDAGEVNE